MAYDAVFRRHTIEYKDAGHAFKKANEVCGDGSKRYYSQKEQREKAGSLENRPPRERSGKTNKSGPARLPGERPGRNLRECAEKLAVCPQAISEMFEKPGVARKKNYLFGKVGV
jgi:hypothetical protein